MKKMYKFMLKSLFGLMAFALLTGCDPGSNDDGKDCYKSLYIGVNNVTGPTTVPINQPIVFSVDYFVDSTCGNFKDFYVETNGAYERTMTLQVDYNGCSCTPAQTTKSINYSFTPAVSGTYTFKFKVDATNVITKVVTVQ